MIRPLSVFTLVLLSVSLSVGAVHAQGDVRTTPKTIDELTSVEFDAIVNEVNQKVGFPAGSHRYADKNRTKRTHDDWVKLLVYAVNQAEERRVVFYSANFQAIKARVNKQTAALGINYSESDLNSAWTRLEQADVYVTPESLQNLLLADAVLNASKARIAASMTAPSPTSAARPTSGTAPAGIDAVLGTYRYEPYANQWHQGTIQQLADGALVWTNQANISWFLDAADNGRLRKRDGSPYQDQANGKEFVMVRDASGKVTGFLFLGELYRKI